MAYLRRASQHFHELWRAANGAWGPSGTQVDAFSLPARGKDTHRRLEGVSTLAKSMLFVLVVAAQAALRTEDAAPEGTLGAALPSRGRA